MKPKCNSVLGVCLTFNKTPEDKDGSKYMMGNNMVCYNSTGGGLVYACRVK